MKEDTQISELFYAVVEAMLKRGKKGQGFLVERFGNIEVRFNATDETLEGVAPCSMMLFDVVDFSDWMPIAVLTPFDGQVMHGAKTEDELIEYFKGIA